jgi:signal transduction histidine kinase
MKSERLKTELITNVSHDIKTPLTSIINYVDLLKKEKIDNPKANEYIDVLDKKSQRLKKLIEDLVEASKASSGNIRMNIEKLNVVELIKQSLGEFEDKFKERNLDIQSDYSKSEIFIMADSRYLYRSIENMLSNISKYALENSRVYIEVFEENGKVKISMKNISKEKLNITTDELMQRFVRGDKSRTTEGSGLGISIAKSLVEAQNGKFSLNIDGDLFKVEIEF